MANGLDTSSVDPLFSQAQQTSESAIDLAESGAKLPQLLREAVTERVQSSPLFGQREQAAQNLLTAAPEARADLAQLVQTQPLSPTQQQSILAGKRASATVPLLSLNDLLQTLTGGAETAVGAGLSAFDTLLNAGQARAQLAQQRAQDAFNRLLQKATFEESQRQFDVSESRLGKGSAPSPLEQMLADLVSQQLGGQAGVSGEKPNFSPQANGLIWEQPDGSIWQFQDTDWIQLG